MKNDQISEKSKRQKQKQRQRNIHINSVVEFRILKIRRLKYSENIFAPYYESNWNILDDVHSKQNEKNTPGEKNIPGDTSDNLRDISSDRGDKEW